MKVLKYILPVLAILCLLACSDNKKKMTIRHRMVQNDVVSDHRALSKNMQKDSSRNHTVKTTLSQKQTITRFVLKNKRKYIQSRQDNSRLKDLKRRTLSKYFSDNKADTLKAGRAELCVPERSMGRGKVLSITPLKKNELPHLPAGMVNVTGGCDTLMAKNGTTAGYRFLPHGNHFVHSMASIAVPYDSTLIPKGYTADDIHTYYYDELTRKWTLLKSKGIDTKHAVAMAETSHFTDVINGIIKVPESPETQSYVPTGISELKAADPGAGIHQIEAPTANQNGTAALSYPFEAPKGRAGIAASAGLQYSSDGSSSYVGYGWSLPLQSIDIETRWGVPHFSTEYESESYLLMGKQLNDRIYRKIDMDKRKSEKQFSTMVEAGFNKIIRHGDSPKNYWWEVTSKDGTVYSYGGYAGAVDDNTTLTDDNGNRIKWVLKRVTDVHGNFAAYHYTKSGNNLYPQKYTYTGFGTEEGVYSILFDIEDEARADVTRSGRLGILQTEQALLKRVSVKYKDELLRAYDLHYEAGAFGKTLLTSIDQKDSKDALVATQHFDYYNDIKNGMFGDAEEWSVENDANDGYRKLLGHQVKDCDDNLSILGGGYSSGGSGGGGFMIGFGFALGTINVGATYTHSRNTSRGEITFMDIDGDGLPDKIFLGNGGLRYRKNLSGKTGKLLFGKSQLIKGINEFSKVVSSSNTVNTNVAADFNFVTPGVSFGKTWETSRTSVYLSDFNGDGLVDLAKNGTVWFNHIGADGIPTFTPSSTGTPNPIIGHSTEIDSSYIPDYKAIRDSLEKEYPLHDVVRMWLAPFTGQIIINSKITKTTTKGDGIIYSIQKENTVLKRDSILLAGIKQDNIPVSIVAGERIFFRLQSRYSGSEDKVEWAPEITYSSITGNTTTYLGQDLTKYDAAKDFMEGSTKIIPLNKDGQVKITAPYKKEKTNDDVTLLVKKKNKGGESILKRIVLPAGTVANDTYTETLNILESDSTYLSFEMQTNASIDWKKVSWKPAYKYVGTEDSMSIVPSRELYNKPVRVKTSKQMSSILTKTDSLYRAGILLAPELVVKRQNNEDHDTATVYMTINKDDGTLLYKHRLRLNQTNSLARDTIKITDTTTIEAMAAGKIHVSFNIQNELNSALSARLDILRDSLIYTTDSLGHKTLRDSIVRKITSIDASVFSAYNTVNFGPLYKGWGQFAYNGNGEYRNKPIELTALNIDTDKYKNIADQFRHSKKVEDLQGTALTEPKNQRFFVMGYNTVRNAFVSIAEDAYIAGGMQSSARMGENEIEVDSINYATAGEGLSAPVLVSKSNSTDYGVSANVNGKIKFISGGLSGSKSDQSTYTNTASMDLNGDSYPDWITEHKEKVDAHYTRQTGKLDDFKAQTNVKVPHFESSAYTLGASISGAEKTDSKGAIAVSICPKKSSKKSSSEGSNAGDGNKISATSVCASGNFTKGSSETKRDWADLNGDGLPDMLIGGNVRYNLGYGFTDEQPSGVTDLGSSSNSTWGAGLGMKINILGPADISGGINGTKTTTKHNALFSDLNGDGLPDMINRDNNDFTVRFNTGNGFLSDNQQGKGDIGKSLATSISGHGDFSVKINVYTPVLKFTLTPIVNAATSEGVSRTLSSITDIDGDGYPDIVESKGSDKLLVHRNLTGRTNMLKSVTLPFGGHIDLAYERTKPTFDLPGSRYVLSSVEVRGGYKENGAARLRNEFTYEGGFRNRKERDFYGFEKVITKQIDTEDNDKLYRYSVQTFGKNHNYYTHDLVTEEALFDANDKQLQGTVYSYNLKVQKDTTVIFPALATVKQSIYDETTGASMSTTITNDYDAYGNLVSYKETATNYELDADIAYHDLQAKYIVSVPKYIAVKDKGGKVYRERSTQINGNGDITSITMHNSDKPSVYDMTYDAYGNLASLTKPENHKGQRMRYNYTYDDVLHALVTSVKDAYDYTSSTVYDYKWGVPTETTDLNGNKMRYAYDDMGRPSTILGPKEIATGKPYTIKFEYNPVGRYARTVHYSPEGDIETYTFADSLMHAVQTKQTGVVWTGGSNQKVSIVSGRAVVDAFGRTIKAFYPTTESYGSIGAYNTTTGDPQGTTEYDAYDRTTKVTLPDGATTTTAYSIVSHDGEPMLETRVTDALGRNAESYTDEKGRNRETMQHASGDNITVKYDYDAVGQITTVHHPNDKTTTYEYDLLGHKLKVNHPDAGEVSYTYDAAGNLLTKLTAELKKRISADAPITYTYDYERLSEVLYPKNLFNRVTYTYGKPGEKYNRAGRLVLVEDASGGEAYYYGNQGEVVKTVRSVMVSTADVRTYVYGATYDSWNRVRTMTYPDGEVVTYAYNAAGQIASIKSNKQGKEETIVEKVGYDKDGHTVYTKLGNGTETTYTYDKRRERLQEMNLTEAGTSIMHNKYQYDAVDNILGITNAVDPTRGNTNGDKKLGGAFKHSYAYDDLNRLVYASGKAKQASYSMQMTFGRMSEPLTKIQKVDSTKTAQSYGFTYKYEDSNHLTAPTQIGHEHYTYDANGNPTLVENDSLGTERRMYWDEDNRLMVLSDNGKTSRYTYNAAGERIIKSHGDLEGVYINGAPQGITFHETEDYTIYPAPIITVTKNRFTKHYFIGDKRVASKLGVGKFSNVYGISGNNVTAGQKDYATRMMQIEKQREEYYKSLGTPPGVPTMKGATADPDNTGRGYNDIIGDLGDHSVPEGWVQRPKFNEKGDVPGPPIQWQKPEDPDNAQPGYGYVPADTTNTEDIFFYHSDHLGSTSYITDAKANITQFDAYLPYGELLVDEHSSSEDMPYKFNGKELDSETGLYYYGARYMNPVTSLWYGVDPLAEKYPNNSVYCYAANNSVKFIDTDGRKLRFAPGTSTAFKLKFRAAIQYLHEHKADGIIAQIEKSSTIIYIAEKIGESSAFSSKKKTIYWNPDIGLLTSSDKALSPTTILNHEADHTLQYLKDPQKNILDSHTEDPDYDNKEEFRVITGAEQRTAFALGEIKDGEVTRTDHRGTPYITKSVTTTEAKNGERPKNPYILEEIVISAPSSKNVTTNDNKKDNDSH